MSQSKTSRRGAQAPLLGSQHKISIEKLAVGGAGVARAEGFVLFVPDSAPGDELLVEISAVKKNFGEARILEILTAGPARRKPPCPVAGVCGGCNWQHLEEVEQQKQKELFVRETLLRFLPGITFDYLPLKPSPAAFRYRNRIQPKFKDGRFGFYARESHDLVEIQDCLITEEALARKIPEARKWALSQRSEGRLEMYLDPQQEVHFAFADQPDEGIGFSQVNRFQNEDLVATVLEWAAESDYEKIYDLYAGAGNFSFPLSAKFKKPVTAVELSAKLVEKGRSMASDALRFVGSDVEKYLLHAPGITSRDLIVLDPPRAGCSEAVMRSLAQAGPRKIIYISCHPVSLARDLKWFFQEAARLGKPNLGLRRARAFEMFPQTDHVETIIELGVDS